MRNPQHTILIVCEGDNTEPLFFNSIRDLLKSGEFKIGDIEITIRPEPRVEDNDEPEIASPHKQKRKQQQLRKVNTIHETEVITGIPPLKWVLEAQKDLADGTFNEAWTVFDHDNHPARKEAFEAAKQEIIGKKVNIAFSSISFEYYLLLHFERIYYRFEKSECRMGKKLLNCNSGDCEHDCYGSKCVGGYLRNSGYFSGSTKVRKSVFPFIKDKLEIAFENSAWLRLQSEQNEQDIPEYDRNPYITTDDIVKRLTGIETNWIWILTNKKYQFKNFAIFIDNQK
ncbi:MAG: RloB family protein, partial [Bacteroidota bacterium]|nr:RloB family protein [Bacteroidota bacterium]